MKLSSRVAFLVAAILLIGLGAAFIFHVPISHVVNLASLALLFGGVTVTYKYPVSGTTAPTSTLMQQHCALTALVNALDSDTVITITHNWGLPSKDAGGFPDGPAGLFPVVVIDLNSDATTTVEPIFLVNLTNTNAVVINKPTTVGTQGTYIVQVLRPNSAMK